MSSWSCAIKEALFSFFSGMYNEDYIAFHLVEIQKFAGYKIEGLYIYLGKRVHGRPRSHAETAFGRLTIDAIGVSYLSRALSPTSGLSI
jgi:hypothetical protein